MTTIETSLRQSPALLPGLALLLSTVLTAPFLARCPSHPFSNPKHPALLHHLLLPQLISTLTLYAPIPRRLKPYLAFPPIFACYYTLLGTSSPISPPTGYAIGTFIAFHSFKCLELFIFTPPPERRPTGFWDAVGLSANMRGIGEEFCTPLPRERDLVVTESGERKIDRSRWWRRRIIRLLVVWIWLDVLTWWMRYADAGYYTPIRLGMAESVEKVYLFPGTRNAAHDQQMANVTVPLPFDLEPPLEGTWTRTGVDAAVYTLRILLAGTAIIGAITGAQCAISIVLAGLGEITGYRKGWCGIEAWPDTFGHPQEGDFGYGIRGFWSRGWHQLFRRVFIAPVEWAFPRTSKKAVANGTTNKTTNEKFLSSNGGWRRSARKLGYSIVPFFLSSLLHFLGVWTASLPNRGWGAFQFFLLQPLGVFIETPLLQLRSSSTGTRRQILKVMVYIWTVTWLVITARGFFEEYRWSGLWWTEPVPFRWIGEGGKLTWRWGGQWMRWAHGAEGGIAGDWGIVFCG
ncbi:hypothetical protein EX30DRAFT_368280 [Ascodesmis nigricans]|uniref:Wax synthase domain-containing protein n=1 Tax=Ascodesmis nigricans TaxID=341454 RepID=A0A4S2N7Q2_9PEZI|nr:hypothetical protein EX30DRAFT_368280 [Ascodesmis nigricans]